MITTTAHKLRTIVDGIVSFFVISIHLFTILAFGICNLLFIFRYSDVFSLKEWIWLLPACLLAFFVYFFSRFLNDNCSERMIIIIGLFFANLLYLFFVFSYPTQPVSDWHFVWTAANQISNGSFTSGLIPGEYMHEIPYQLGMALLESFVIRAFGANYSVFKIINILIMNGILLGIYHFAKRKSSRNTATYVYIGSSVFLCWAMSVPQFTNHQICTLLLLFTLYCFEQERPWFGVISGIVLSILNFLRPMGILLVVAFICYTLYEILSGKPLFKTVAKLVLCLAMYYGGSFILDSYMFNKGYTDVYISRSNRNLYHKITYGMYDSKVDGRIADYNYDYEAYENAYKAEILEQVTNNKKELLINTANKMCRYLGMFDYAFEMTYNHDETVWTAYPVKSYYSIQWFQYVIYSIIGLFGYIRYRNKHRTDLYQIFYIGNTLVYFFVEAFSTYRFENYFYMLFLMGYGLNYISQSKINREIEEG